MYFPLSCKLVRRLVLIHVIINPFPPSPSSNMTGTRTQSVSQPDHIQTTQLLGILEKVTKRLKEGTGGSGTSKPKVFTVLAESDVRTLFTHLRDVLSTLVSSSLEQEEQISTLETSCEDISHQVSLSKEKIISLEKSSRTMSDQSDHHYQRSLRGKFSITPSASDSLCCSKDLESEDKRLSYYICELVHHKYAIDIMEQDISACHFTKKGIVFRLLNLSPTSSYGELSRAIKSNQGSRIKDFFFNFALTPKRAELLYELRLAKRAKKIERLYSDSDGSISYVLPSSLSSSPVDNSRGKREKVRITSIFDRVEGKILIRTLTPMELREKLDPPPTLDLSL